MLLLEIGAIFIGITSSFLVDEWRERQQDTETFHRILGEIYYEATLDGSTITGWAADNNRALVYASALALREPEPPPADVLTEQLNVIFSTFAPSITLGGYTRLTNTALNVPVNDIQLALDNLYGVFVAGNETYMEQLAELREIGDAAWWGAGIVPCTDELAGLGLTPAQHADLDIPGQVAPARDAIRRGGECLPQPVNEETAARLLAEESFRRVLRRVIALRRDMAVQLIWQRSTAASILWRLEDYLPGVRLPIETLGLVGTATPAEWDAGRALEMNRIGATEWEIVVRLTDGEVKFAANRDWIMNWGAPRPWVATGSAMGFEAGQLRPGEAFPAGTAWFNGLNIPVPAGTYRVRLDTRSGEYSFESAGD